MDCFKNLYCIYKMWGKMLNLKNNNFVIHYKITEKYYINYIVRNYLSKVSFIIGKVR